LPLESTLEQLWLYVLPEGMLYAHFSGSHTGKLPVSATLCDTASQPHIHSCVFAPAFRAYPVAQPAVHLEPKALLSHVLTTPAVLGTALEQTLAVHVGRVPAMSPIVVHEYSADLPV